MLAAYWPTKRTQMRAFRFLYLLLLTFCIHAFSLKAAEPLVYGQSFELYSKHFEAPRRYAVSLPERYYLDERQYPTLYVVDADFQFHHVANVVRHLARMGKLPPMIVVGVANQGNADYLMSTTWTVKDSEEFDSTVFGGVDTFNRFLYRELVPQIDKTYRTNNKKALAGYSLGGLFVLQSYLDKDSPFNAFLAMSPSVWYDNYSLVEKYKQNLATKYFNAPLFVSLANEKGMGVTELVEVLEGAEETISNWQFKQYPNESHYTTALPALYDGLQFLAPDYFVGMGKLMAQTDYMSALDLFEANKSSWTSFHFGWLQSYTFAKYVFASKQTESIDAILAAIKQRFPDSHTQVTIDLALGFNRKGQPEEAKKRLLTVASQAAHLPHWHYQMSLAELALGNEQKAKLSHSQAMAFAKAAKLESWEIWEMEPNKFLGAGE